MRLAFAEQPLHPGRDKDCYDPKLDYPSNVSECERSNNRYNIKTVQRAGENVWHCHRYESGVKNRSEYPHKDFDIRRQVCSARAMSVGAVADKGLGHHDREQRCYAHSKAGEDEGDNAVGAQFITH